MLLQSESHEPAVIYWPPHPLTPLPEESHVPETAAPAPYARGKAASPVDLSLVTAFQTLEDLSDRQAAEAVRLRLD